MKKFRIYHNFSFEASHTIPYHNKCGRLHGHSYKVTIILEGDKLENGMLIDFGEIRKISKEIEDKLDHTHLNNLLLIPTAEMLAKLIFEYFENRLKELNINNVRVKEVIVQETERNKASYVDD
ncbi:MAG: 6-carboxytetrahydropterin synthase QueD [Candidatus Aenigmatarchaeota archaeon]